MADDNKYLMFHNRLAKVFRHLSKTARRQGISCYRIYDHDLPEFPLSIEIYEDKVSVAEYKRHHHLSDEAHAQWLENSLKIIGEVLQIPAENIFTRLRRRKPGRLGQYQKTDTALNEFIVQENGLKFIVNLSDYLDTGLFLDHRITRKMVMDESAGKRVLNLFAYTGSFSIYAAAGGASKITTVDLSKTYLQWAERNLHLNGFQGPQYEIVHADVLQYLKTLAPASFDIIVMDPPTFSNSKRMENFLDIQKDHVELINNCMNGLSDEGILYFSTNFTKFQLQADKLRATTLKDITKATTPFDFEGKLKRWCYRIS